MTILRYLVAGVILRAIVNICWRFEKDLKKEVID